MKDPVVVVNENDEVIGEMERQDAHKNGTPHRIAVVYIENGEGKFLVQVRATGRLDHSSAGHVDPGELYLEAAQRELEEELGIRDEELVLIGRGVSEEKFDGGEHRVHVFEAFVCRAEPGELHPEEVKDVYWADPYEVLQEMQENPDDLKFTAGFRESLPLYIKYIENK